MIHIAPATAGEYETALELLFNRLPPDARQSSIADVLNALRSGRISLHGLLIARTKGEIAGAVLFLIQEDRTAFVWPPGIRAGQPNSVRDALLRDLIERVERAGAWIAQCLINPDWTEDRERLARNGFAHLTDLRFLVRPLGELHNDPAAADSDPDLVCETFQPELNGARFARLLELTYVETRDCPELEGRRKGEHALTSHRMSGEFDPSRWTLFRWHDQDAAVLLMNDHPEQRLWELVYMGVARDFRGHGLGRRILSRGLAAARAAGKSGVLLAVDYRNDVAAAIYDELGFLETDRKSAHVFFPASARQGVGGQ